MIFTVNLVPEIYLLSEISYFPLTLSLQQEPWKFLIAKVKIKTVKVYTHITATVSSYTVYPAQN